MKFQLTLLLVATFISTFSFGQIKLEDVKVDTTITGFHLASSAYGKKIFRKEGINNSTHFAITVAQGVTFIDAKRQIGRIIAIAVEDDHTVTNISELDTTLNGNKAYYLSYTDGGAKNNYKDFLFYALVIKDNTLILFSSDDLDNGQFIDKFKKTFYTLKL